MNPVPRLAKYRSIDGVLLDRLAIISEITGWTRAVIRDWAIAHAVLSAWWDIQPNGKGGTNADRVARLYTSLELGDKKTR